MADEEIDIVFFLDLTSNLLFRVIKFVLKKLNQKVHKRDKLRYTCVLRVLLGIVFDVAYFIIICTTESDRYRATSATNGLFIWIVVYISVVFFIEILAYLFVLFKEDIAFDKTYAMVKKILILYKCFQIPFDIFCVAYEACISGSIDGVRLGAPFLIGFGFAEIFEDIIEVMLQCFVPKVY